MNMSEEKRRVKIIYGEIVQSEFETETKVFLLPAFEEEGSSPEFELTREQLKGVSQFFYDHSIFTHPQVFSLYDLSAEEENRKTFEKVKREMSLEKGNFITELRMHPNDYEALKKEIRSKSPHLEVEVKMIYGVPIVVTDKVPEGTALAIKKA